MALFKRGKWLEAGRGIKREKWCSTYRGCELKGTEYEISLYTILEINSKTGDLRAYRIQENNELRKKIDPQFAIEEIVKLDGTLRKDLLSKWKKDRRSCVCDSKKDIEEYTSKITQSDTKWILHRMHKMLWPHELTEFEAKLLKLGFALGIERVNRSETSRPMQSDSEMKNYPTGAGLTP